MNMGKWLHRFASVSTLLVLTLTISDTAHAQPNEKTTVPPTTGVDRAIAIIKSLPQDKLGKLFDKFATMAGGWFLEQRCKTLRSELLKEFEWNVAQINIALGRATRPDFVMQMQRAAERTAETYHCDDKSAEIVVVTFVESRVLAKELTGLEYSPKTKARHDVNRTARLLQAQIMDNSCRMMPADVRNDFDSNVQKVLNKLAQNIGADAVTRLKQEVQKSMDGKQGECVKTVRDFLSTAHSLAASMAKE